jgi:electron transport complex protein RnfD
MLMAFFMATDPTTTPASTIGKLLVGIGIGLIIILIRNLGGFPEEIFISVLIMNGLTPIINLRFKPKQLI